MELKKLKLMQEAEALRQLSSVGGLGSSNGQIQPGNSKQNSVANLGNSVGSPRLNSL